MIPKGKFDWYDPQKIMSNQAASLFNTLADQKQYLPALPHAMLEIQQLISNPLTSAPQLAKAIKKAPIIASNIFELANNLLKSRQNDLASSLEHAITIIGLTTLNELSYLAGLHELAITSKIFDLDTFWEKSFLTGRIAEKLAAKYTSDLPADRVYIAGALSNIGKLVQALISPEKTDAMEEDLNNLDILGTWQDMEKRHNMPPHTTLGEIACVFWGMPEYITQVAADHHHHHSWPLDVNGSKTVDLIQIVGLANQIGHWLMLHPNQIDKDYLNKACKRFGLSQKQLETMVETMMELR